MKNKLIKFHENPMLDYIYTALIDNGVDKEDAARVKTRGKRLNELVMKFNRKGDLPEEDWDRFESIYDETIEQAKHLIDELEKRAQWAIEHPDFAKLEQVPVQPERCYISAQFISKALNELEGK